MIVYRIAKEKWINDLSGLGAKMTGGRWNPRGYPILYCASNSSLAILEKLVNIDYDLLPDDLFIAELEIPDEAIDISTLNPGVYMVKAISENAVYSERVVVQW